VVPGSSRSRRSAILVVAVVLVVCTAAAAQAATLGVTSTNLGATSIAVTITSVSSTGAASTTANQASPNTNSGTSTTLTVQSATLSRNQRTFVRFDLSSIPTSARVDSATLRLTMFGAPSASRTYEVDRANAAWGETTLTWNNMPTAAAATATVASGTTSNVNLSWDVTPDVGAFVANSAVNFGWQIKDTVESSTTTRTATFRSDEYATSSQRPTLTVIYAN
jgi:hypothetical protein